MGGMERHYQSITNLWELSIDRLHYIRKRPTMMTMRTRMRTKKGKSRMMYVTLVSVLELSNKMITFLCLIISYFQFILYFLRTAFTSYTIFHFPRNHIITLYNDNGKIFFCNCFFLPTF